MGDALRITGLISGMDTDSTVQKLIKLEQTKVDQVKQEKQYLEWQKEDYRDVANLLRGFQDDFFEVLSPTSNMRSSTAFNMFAGSASVAGVDSSAVTISTTAKSIVGSISIDSVTRLATKDSYASGSEVFGNIISGDIDTIANINTQLAIDNTMSFSLDGVSKTITLEAGGYADHDAFITDINTKLQAEYTNVDIVVDKNGVDPFQLEFNIYQSGTTTDETGHVLTIDNDNTALLDLVALSVGDSNTVNLSATLADVFGKSGNTSLTINDTVFSFADTTSVSEVMSQINSSVAGVTLSYDTFTDKFTFESNSVGTDAEISITDTSGLFADFKLQGGGESHTGPVNSEFVVNGVTTTRSSNTFEINGTSITLNEVPAGAVDVTINADATDAKALIVKFVESYNKLISTLNDKVDERKNYDYEPLTTEQKSEMTDDDIETWQAQAKKGTLRNDVQLSSITSSLRTAMYEAVEGLGISLYEIGIQSSPNYKDAGKLEIDETKLDAALAERPNEIIELFTKESDTTYASYTNRTTRNSENGLSNRIYDILQDNIRLTRNDDGQRGYLIETAGLETGIDTTSDMASKIIAMDERIDDLLDYLASQESKYYQQFASMEAAMSAYSNQSAWLSSQFGGA